MKKSLSKFLSALVVLALSFFFVSCGDSDDKNDTESVQTQDPNNAVEALLSSDILNMSNGYFKFRAPGPDEHGDIMGVWMRFIINEDKSVTAERSEVRFASIEAESPFEIRTATYKLTGFDKDTTQDKVYKIKMVGVSAIAKCLNDDRVTSANSSSWYGYNDWVKDEAKDITGKKQHVDSDRIFLTAGAEEEHSIKIEDKDHIRIMEEADVVLTFEAAE